MKIWEVMGFDSGGITFYFETTKAAAEARKREMVQNSDEMDSWDSIEIEPRDIAPTRQGICNALNNLIDRLCSNEH